MSKKEQLLRPPIGRGYDGFEARLMERNELLFVEFIAPDGSQDQVQMKQECCKRHCLGSSNCHSARYVKDSNGATIRCMVLVCPFKATQLSEISEAVARTE